MRVMTREEFARLYPDPKTADSPFAAALRQWPKVRPEHLSRFLIAQAVKLAIQEAAYRRAV